MSQEHGVAGEVLAGTGGHPLILPVPPSSWKVPPGCRLGHRHLCRDVAKTPGGHCAFHSGAAQRQGPPPVSSGKVPIRVLLAFCQADRILQSHLLPGADGST